MRLLHTVLLHNQYYCRAATLSYQVIRLPDSKTSTLDTGEEQGFRRRGNCHFGGAQTTVRHVPLTLMHEYEGSQRLANLEHCGEETGLRFVFPQNLLRNLSIDGNLGPLVQNIQGLQTFNSFTCAFYITSAAKKGCT